MLDSMLGPTFSADAQKRLFRSGIPVDSPLEGHPLGDLVSITPGLASSHP